MATSAPRSSTIAAGSARLSSKRCARSPARARRGAVSVRSRAASSAAAIGHAASSAAPRTSAALHAARSTAPAITSTGVPDRREAGEERRRPGVGHAHGQERGVDGRRREVRERRRAARRDGRDRAGRDLRRQPLAARGVVVDDEDRSAARHRRPSPPVVTLITHTRRLGMVWPGGPDGRRAEREAVHILAVADRDELIAAVGAALGLLFVVADPAAAEGVASAGDLALVVLDATDGGLSAVAALRRAHGEAPLPILAVGPDTADHRARAHAAGVDDYLAAPLDPARLRERAAVWARWRAAVAAPTARLADARRLAQLEDELARRIAHDLIAPVAGVDGFLRLLARDPAIPRAPGILVGQALQAVTALRTLVEDLRRIPRARGRHARAAPRRGRAPCPGRGGGRRGGAGRGAPALATLTVVGEPLEARADPPPLGRALELLVASAVRAAPRRGAVTATIAAAPTAAVIDRRQRRAARPGAARRAVHPPRQRAGPRRPVPRGADCRAPRRRDRRGRHRAGGGTVARLTLPRGG